MLVATFSYVTYVGSDPKTLVSVGTSMASKDTRMLTRPMQMPGKAASGLGYRTNSKRVFFLSSELEGVRAGLSIGQKAAGEKQEKSGSDRLWTWNPNITGHQSPLVPSLFGARNSLRASVPAIALSSSSSPMFLLFLITL